jgi:hypothetical protein
MPAKAGTQRNVEEKDHLKKTIYLKLLWMLAFSSMEIAKKMLFSANPLVP